MIIDWRNARKNAPVVPRALNTKTQDFALPKTDGITAAAAATALGDDPVAKYQQQQEAQKGKPASKARPILDSEIKEKRTAFSNTYLNTAGGETERIYNEPVNYKPNGGKGAWTPIVGELKQDTSYNDTESGKESLLSRLLPGKPFIKKGLRQDTGFVRGTFRSLAESDGITVGADGTASFNVTLLGADPQVNPELGTYEDGGQYTIYKDAWRDSDVYYEQRGTSLKETIVLKSKDAPTTFSFRFTGAKLSFGVDDSGKQNNTIVAQLKDGSTVVLPELSVMSKVKGPLDSPKMHYELDGNVVRVVLDAKWFATLSADKFPILVDPTYDWRGVSTGIPGGDLGDFIAYDSRGYGCNSNICDVYAGSLNDGGWKNWRTMMHLPLSSVYGQSVDWANIYTERVNRPNAWNGFNGNRPYEITWANCFGYNCFSGAPRATAWVDWSNNFDATALMQWISTNNVGDGWLMIKAVDEGDINGFKSFSGGHTYLDVNFVHWNQQTALPTLDTPAQNAVVSVSRPTLKINPVGDPDNDLVRYAFQLLDSKGNIVAHSGELDTTWWTIPDNVLVDGETYSWRAFVMERNAGNPSVVESGWRQQPEVRSFKFDLRTGKDKTQSYDDVGPLSVSLNRGNGYTSVATQTINALGGDIGLGLDYNTPGLSQYGLTASYYNGTDANKQLAITVKDPNIDMIWGGGSPYPGSVQADNFSVNWQGYFVAPQEGAYTFGASRDDNMSMSITNNGTQDTQFDFGCCGTNWATKSITLKRGEAYPISVWYTEATGYADAHLLARLPDGSEVTVPSEWLRTLPDATSQYGKGLTARFYKTDANNTNFVINDQTPLVFSTNVAQVDRDWGTGSLLPYDIGGVYNDYMIVNYSGYVTIPADGKYQIGGGSDDGMRIRLGGKEVVSGWTVRGYTEGWSPELDLKAGQILPISVDYFEKDGGARVNLQWKSSTNAVAAGVIPGQYLLSAPKVVPDGWNLSIDPDGNIPYESLQAKSSGNVDLVDSDGFVHAYTWTGSGFKPPVDEDGYLIRNADATYTLTDVDGRVYNFSVEGQVMKVSSPIDDRNPAALQYEYTDLSTAVYGSLPKLSKIKDGVDPSRYGQVYYWGDAAAQSVCTVPSGYDTPAPGYLCAFQTFPDNRVTTFAYKGGQLVRVDQPGGQRTDFAYETDGRLVQVRDVLANDAIAAGVRAQDGTETTQISYDALRRITKVTTPAPFGSTVPDGQSNTRAEHIFQYGAQDTKRQITGVPAPAGYQQYIEYDNLYRTTKACNQEGLCNTSEYDPTKDLMLSVVDPQGLKSTTLYDADDRPTDTYGPAPKEWFGADRKPLAAYVNQVPHTQTGYDEGMKNLAVAFFGYRTNSLAGAPKLHQTGIDPANLNATTKAWGSTPPVTVDASKGETGWGFSATGKIKVATTGTYYFNVWHDDGARLFIDDQQVTNNWANGANRMDQGTFTLEANKSYRIRLDYYDADKANSSIDVFMAYNRQPTTGDDSFGALLSPAYDLTTSTKVSDSQLGDKTNVTNYGATPELGLPVSNTTSGGGLSLTATTAYEAPGAAGSLLRKTNKTSVSGATTTYAYYGATETRANPCVVGSPSVSQAGFIKLKTEPTAASTGGAQVSRTSEIVYDQVGRPVASRIGTEPWSCTEYDDRGRKTRIVTPDNNGRTGRTLTANYAVNGNPLISSITDSTTGTVTLETDLWGRSLKSTDTFGYTTTLTYDSIGRISKKQSLKGTETLTYDDYSRVTGYAVDGVTYATVTYDSFGRPATVEYPQATNNGNKLKLSQIKHDAYQQDTGATFTFSDGSTYDETVTRTAQTGLVTASTVTYNGKTVQSNYQYDGVGRLTSATIDNWKYDYVFGNQAANCAGLTGYNANASKSGNRTSYTVTNTLTSQATTTTSCYNIADQLLSSADQQVGTPKYDAHGNVTELAGGGTPMVFAYNASDQNISITQGGNKVEYTKDASNNVLVKKEYRAGTLDKVYRSTGSVLLSCDLQNQTQCGVLDRYISLPGGVTLTLSATTTAATPPPAPLASPATTGLPSPWLTTKFGPAAQQGSASYANGVFTVTSSGTDMWGTVDQEQLVTVTLEGDGQIVARVTSQTNTDPMAKAGLLVKNTLKSNAIYQAVAVTPGNGIRAEGNYNAAYSAGSYSFPNAWLKVVRAGNIVTTYKSPDGVTWTQVNSANYSLRKTLQIGMFALSHNANAASTATFDNVTVTPTAASTLPAGWTNGDTGNPPTPAGTSAYANGVFTLTGRDGDVWGTADQAQRAYQTLTGDGQIVARVVTQTNSNAWAKAGVFIKASPADMSDYASLHITPANGLTMEWNYNDGSDSFSYTKPVWLKLVRQGNAITGYSSPDGANWTLVGSTEVPNLPATAIIGLMEVSGDVSVTGTATFDNVAITPTSTPLPAGWSHGDTGNPDTTGDSSYSNGVFTVKGAGYDVWQNGNTDDQSQIAYQTLTGDGQIVARVTSQTNTGGPWAKAGVFIKASPQAGSQYASVHTTPGNGIRMQFNYTNDVAGGSYAFPVWLKLVRAGNTITAYRSADGTTWTQLGSTTNVNLPSTAIIGLFNCATSDTTLSTATFDNVAVTGGAQATPPPAAPAPTASPATYSIQNFHGDTAITAGSTGAPISSVSLYDPFGGSISSNTFGTTGAPQNASDISMGWAASPVRKQEKLFTLAVMQMGARIYAPSLGRFLQVDPIEGGTPNPYVYVLDPINGNDYSGLFACMLQCTVSVYTIQPAAQVAHVQPAAPASSIVQASAPSRSKFTPISIPPATAVGRIYGVVGGLISASGDSANGIITQSSVFGRQLRLGSSVAGRNLVSVSRLANNSVIRVVDRAAGPLAIGVDFAGNYLAGDGLRRSALEAGGGAAGGAIGAFGGGVACGFVTFGTGGLAAVTCPTLVVGLGAAGSWAGGKIGGLVSDALDW